MTRIHIKPITWQDTIPIRHAVLWPNKLPEFCYVEEDEEKDEEAAHYGGFVTLPKGCDNENRLVCVASVYRNTSTPSSARLRKFATLGDYQGQGIGRRVLQNILDKTLSPSTPYFWCDARDTAVAFYEQFGLHVEGERFYKSEQAYYKMSIRYAT